MGKFYSDINKINCKYLLEATPFRIDPKVNFLHKLDEDTFFAHLYKTSNKGVNYKENELFDRRVLDALKDVDYEYAKVEMVHIAGYGGCGKTTFVRHLLWKRQKESKFTYEVIDYEGIVTAAEPLLTRVSKRLERYYGQSLILFLKRIAREEIFDMNRFSNALQKISWLAEYLEKENCIDEYCLKKFLKEQIPLFEKMEDFLAYLLTLDFFILLYKQCQTETKDSIIILIDNVDSLSDLHEESMLISAIKDFITNCNFFFGHNLDCQGIFEGKSLKNIIENTKLVFFLTTRIVTIKRYMELYPDLENMYGWNSVFMPEHYYDHRGIINCRVKYYLEKEKDSHSKTIGELLKVKELSEVAYYNNNFKRLFNGNIRFCVERLCDIALNYSDSGIVQQCIDLYKLRNEIPEAITGSNGMILAMVLTEFKNNGVYKDKLRLSECKQDNEVSLSRIILTILREKGGRCSMLELYELLSPFYKIEDITNDTWALNEMCREIWRRLLMFNVKFPTHSIELRKQAQAYEKGNFKITEYSEVNLCPSGLAYIDYVIPHFEFMLSRHNYNVQLFDDNRLWPLFANSSEDLITSAEFKYRFEKKINWVYQDVKDCCFNSVHFSNQVCDYYKITRDDYINNTVYNYQALAADGTARLKQSYESRLIFSHIGYIERYRRYLLKKHKKKDDTYLADINQRLIRFIKLYLCLYTNGDICYQTNKQNEAARELIEAIDFIARAGYRDYKTKIETKGVSV